MTVDVTVNDHVAVVSLNRPEVRNAIDLPTAELIEQVLDECDSNAEVRAIVFTGAGRSFCAGMDLKAVNAGGARPITKGRGAFGIVERPPRKPMIAAVEGFALGGGFEIALCADIIVGASDARFGLPEVKRGLVAAAGGVIRLPRRVPYSTGLEMILTGEPVTAERALAIGLLNYVTEPGGALAKAVEVAAVIAANAPMAVRAAKAIVLESADWSSDEAFAAQRVHTDPVRASQDAREGVAAFAEKRSPQWIDG